MTTGELVAAVMEATAGAYKPEEVLGLTMDWIGWLMAGRRAFVRRQAVRVGAAAGGDDDRRGGCVEVDLPGGRKVVRYSGAEGMEELRRLARRGGGTVSVRT